MNKAVFDTRFFIESFYTKDQGLLQRIREQKRRDHRFVSSVVIYEVYKITLLREGRVTAKTRAVRIMGDFETVPVDNEIAQLSAELGHKYHLSMGDSIIAGTAQKLGAVCISDDPHFTEIKEIKTTWL